MYLSRSCPGGGGGWGGGGSLSQGTHLVMLMGGRLVVTHQVLFDMINSSRWLCSDILFVIL